MLQGVSVQADVLTIGYTGISDLPGMLGHFLGGMVAWLPCAAWKGHTAVVSLLLDYGADVNARNDNGHWGNTPLHAAAHGNQRAVAEVLIARGADIQAVNCAGRTPLVETEVHQAKAVANLLRQHGATH